MTVLVIGANGKVGRQVVALLAESGHAVRAMIRDRSQAAGVEQRGGEPVLADLESDFDHALDGCDAVVFTAGSGGHTGADKTVLVDGLGAIRAVDAARDRGVRRFVMVSSIGADDPDRSDRIRHYLVAKGIADAFLERSGVPYTILRPGRLTDEPPTGRIRIGRRLGSGSIRRGDVARTVVAALATDRTRNRTFELLDGEVPIEEALAGL